MNGGCQENVLERGHHTAQVVPPLQNEIFSTLRIFPDLVRIDPRLPNPAVWRRFRLFGTRWAGDIHTSKFGPIGKGYDMAHVFPPLQKEVSATLQVTLSFPCCDLLCSVDKALV